MIPAGKGRPLTAFERWMQTAKVVCAVIPLAAVVLFAVGWDVRFSLAIGAIAAVCIEGGVWLSDRLGGQP